MLVTVAGFASDDYVISLRQGYVPGVEARVHDSRLIISMLLHNSNECAARFMGRPNAETAQLGGIFMIPPNYMLQMGNNGGLARAFNCVIAPRLFEQMMDGRGELSDEQLARALDLRSAAISFCMRHLMKETLNPGPESRKLMDSLVSVLLIELSRELLGGERVLTDSRSALTDERLEKIMDYIETFPAGVPSVADIAAHCGLSTQYFSRQFRERTGQSVGRFIAASRLRRAERLLVETNLPLKEIAYRLGFANSATFSTAFRNEMRVPPGTYREQRLASFAPVEKRAPRNLGPGARLEIVNRAPAPSATPSGQARRSPFPLRTPAMGAAGERWS